MRQAHDSISEKRNGNPIPVLENRIGRILLIVVGFLSVGLGVVGLFIPVLPTTPFLLLAAASFARSSSRLHRWLLNNRIFGAYFRRYHSKEGLPLTSKIIILVFLWATLGASAIFAVPRAYWWIKILLAIIGIGVTIHILQIGKRRCESAADE